jgi:hypothetical protein
VNAKFVSAKGIVIASVRPAGGDPAWTKPPRHENPRTAMSGTAERMAAEGALRAFPPYAAEPREA